MNRAVEVNLAMIRYVAARLGKLNFVEVCPD